MDKRDEKLAGINRVLDAVLDQRVALHMERAETAISVPHYMAGLKACREVESLLEAERRALGATSSLAFDLSIAASGSV